MNIQDAIADASAEWTENADIVIKAMLKLDIMMDDLMDNPGDTSETRAAIWDARKSLFNQLDGMRDNILCNYRRSVLSEMTAAEIEAVDTFNDELDDAVTSVSDAIKQMERGQ